MLRPTFVVDRLRAEAVALLAGTGLVARDAITLATPKANIAADLSFPVFAAAKAAGGNPNAFALELAGAAGGALTAGSLIGKVEALGGFVNLSVDPVRFAAAALDEVQAHGDAFGKDASIGAGQRVVLEYSSPNIARKMHVGHLRTTVIGHSLHLILLALGYEVIADNHLGDWGTQFGTLLAALDLWKREPWNDADPVQALVHIYAQYNNAARLEEWVTSAEKPNDKDDSPEAKHWRMCDELVRAFRQDAGMSLTDLARLWFKRLEDGDVWARETWRRLIDITLVEFDRTYARLHVRFDTTHGESYFEPMMDGLIREAVDKGVAVIEPGGAVSVNFGEGGLPSCLLRKTDGATLYQTRDAATCMYRWREYQPTRNIYVVGAEQKLHFQQVFEIVRRMGYPEIADRSVHISFGAVTDVGGQRFSMRKGTAIFLDEVLNEAVSHARALIEKAIADGRAEIGPEEMDATAELLGIGAVIYNDLYQGPDRNIRFDWDKVLANEGNTAAYLQYAHARCRSILRKAEMSHAEPANAAKVAPYLVTAEEQSVLKQLHRMPAAVREAGEKYAPATIAEWTYGLAKHFNDFYHEHQVLKAATPEVREARLALVVAAAQGIKNGLALLGIQAPERM